MVFNDLFISDCPKGWRYGKAYEFDFGTVFLRGTTENTIYCIANRKRPSGDYILNFKKVLYKTRKDLCKKGPDHDHIITGYKYIV